ncbi:MAG: endonuclease III [Candidatus Bathyarchaeia archaeon]
MDNIALEAEKKRAEQIFSILRASLEIREEDFATLTVARETKDPFQILIVTVLTQNCTDVAALRAFRNLDRQVGVTVAKLAQANVRTIEKAIHVAGLHKQKARGIKRLAKIIAERYSGNIASALNGSFEDVRAELQELPRVGPKTADVLLGVLGWPTISVDTHVYRVSKRLGLAPRKGGEEKVRGALMPLFREEDSRLVPLYFMALGRQICRARKPLCPVCPVSELCPYPDKTT